MCLMNQITVRINIHTCIEYVCVKNTLCSILLRNDKNILFVVLCVSGSKKLLRADWSWSTACCPIQWSALGKGAARP